MELKRFEKDFYVVSPRIDLSMCLSDRAELQIRDFICDNNQLLQFEYEESKDAYLIKRFDQMNNIKNASDYVLTSFMFETGNTVVLSLKTGGDNQFWIPIFLDNGYVIISNLANPGLVLTVSNYTDSSALYHIVDLRPLHDIGDTQESILQQFKISKLDIFKVDESDILDEVNYTIRAPYDSSLAYMFTSGGAFPGSLIAQSYQGNINQKYKFIYNELQKAYQIHLTSNTNLVLTFRLESQSVTMLQNENSLNQYWVLKQISTDKYMIRSKQYINYTLEGYSNLAIGEQNNRENRQRIILEKLKY